MASLEELDFDIHYQGRGAYLDSFLIPALKLGSVYSRLTGFFNVGSLIAVASGLEVLLGNSGQMRLVMGLHDVSSDLLDARSDEASSESARSEAKARLREVIQEIGSLRDALELKQLETLSQMLKSGQLAIKLAKPRSIRSADIFHIKRIIVEDSKGSFVCATGSPNETFAGITGNWEDLSTFKSWKDDTGHAQRLYDSFAEIWEGGDATLEIWDLDDVDVDQIIEAVEERSRILSKASDSHHEENAKAKFLEALDSFVPGHIFMFRGSRLYPHQEFAYKKALSRWPVRALLADEVGLGKTLELGASLSYLIKYGGIKSALILAPKNVTRQLQAELFQKFGLPFAIWDSTNKIYVDAEGRTANYTSSAPCSEGSPDWVIASSQWARGSRIREHLFVSMNKIPDLLVVDEAHAARVAPPDQKSKDSLLYKALEDASTKIPHMILLTATPMQLHVSEYHGLLKLLGMPGRWRKLSNFETALKAQATPDTPLQLNHARIIALLKHDSSQLTSTNSGALHAELEAKQAMDESLLTKKTWKSSAENFIRANPATALTIRNTRSSLEKFGYRFPERVFESPNLENQAALAAIRETLHVYLDRAYGGVEELLQESGRGFSKGFVTSIYEQRAASSIWSLRESLARREEKLDTLLTQSYFSSELEDDDLLDDMWEYDESGVFDKTQMTQSVRDAAQNEKNFIHDVISQIDGISLGPILGDPKISAAVECIERHTSDFQQAIVFSRYTDTLRALLDSIQRRSGLSSQPYGYYTGSECWLMRESQRIDVTKHDLQSALAEGRLSFVLCSDAASEGINLQTASTLINVDVPWNPGRLEQRIGRIARLGQKAPSVTIVNIWYPNSVEGAMYSRLLARKELYDLAVGAFPDLFARGIREAVSLHSAGAGSYSGDVLSRLEEMRESQHLVGLSKLWSADDNAVPISADIWEQFEKASNSIGFDLASDCGLKVQTLSNCPSKFESAGTNSTLFRLHNEFGTWGFKLIADENRGEISLGVHELPQLIELVFGKSESIRSAKQDPFAWTPEHSKLNLTFAHEAETINTFPSPKLLQLEQVGRLRVSDAFNFF